MTAVVRRTVGAAAATALLCTGAVACGGGAGDRSAGASASTADRPSSQVTRALTAAYEKTAKAGSARVSLTMKSPSALGGGTMKMSGTMGWNPTVMDMTMTGSTFKAAEPDAPDAVRMIWQDDVMYVDGGAAAAQEMDGKRWMKLDLGALAEQSGSEQLTRQMTGSLDSMNQDPAQQIAVLLDSPNLKHLGSATLDGVRTEHYKGRLTVEEMMKSNDSLKVLTESERARLLKNVKKAGIKDYDTELWVDKDDLPVRMDVTMDSAQGAVEMSEKFSDYGAAVKADVPPASQTFDLMKMLGTLGAGGVGGTGRGDV
ncbi:hypothetical protein [Streptomyces sp. VRA16 Mangrove soil]|uniref:hypothetical protein n=1 Tax=Streptomyces sp. VRA16 Mangrove soil TaxID=2817434 RepID=UPI001A9F62C2|nr:hypothetical protein [Streptomyces sp. VRA16 Mangrove soil]MBO1334992.1 hypothetical protein [Streptomyces sp. VRA16 Mangrove soil]